MPGLRGGGSFDYLFGDASDSSIPLTFDRDYLIKTSTVNGTSLYKTANFRLYCSETLVIDSTNNAKVHNDGVSTTTRTGAVNLASGVYNAGGNGGNGALDPGGSGDPISNSYAGSGGNGGAGIFSGGGGPGGAVTNSNPTFQRMGQPQDFFEAICGAIGTDAFNGNWYGGGGGGGGAGDGSLAGFGGGAGGGVCFVAAREIICFGTNPHITANGGNGAPSVTAGGGGGGGGGGIVIVVYGAIIGNLITQANGGIGGTGGTLTHAQNGANGTVFLYQV
jgi:hypothetical protein